MFIPALRLRTSYKLRVLPVNINVTSFQSEITETPVLGSKTIPPRGMGKVGRDPRFGRWPLSGRSSLRSAWEERFDSFDV